MGTVYMPNARAMEREPIKRYLLASDFDQTLSFNDSGIVLSEMLGISGFAETLRRALAEPIWSSRAPSWRTCCCTTRSIAGSGART